MKIENRIKNYSASLMNDTKWREVLDLVGKHEILVQFSFVRSEKFNSLIKFPVGGTKENHTTDCTTHGPFFYRDIFAIRCPRFEQLRDGKTGKIIENETRYLKFMNSLISLGQLPVEEDDLGVIIRGYQK